MTGNRKKSPIMNAGFLIICAIDFVRKAIGSREKNPKNKMKSETISGWRLKKGFRKSCVVIGSTFSPFCPNDCH